MSIVRSALRHLQRHRPLPIPPCLQALRHRLSTRPFHQGPPGSRPPPVPKTIDGIQHIIGVSSAKGGVGKSTTAVNLALGLKSLGLQVGLLDGDIYGPSVPRLMNIQDRPLINGEEKMVPLESYGIKCMSMGFLMDADSAAIWRGPMVMAASEQLLHKSDWGLLDVLVIDLPPGTGDIHLTLTQSVALSGAVVVSTPQELALMDARRGISMFNKVRVPILGLLENMSYYECHGCGTREYVFGEDGGKELCSQLGVKLLGQIPLNIKIRQGSDDGKPISISDRNHPVSVAYREASGRVWQQLQGSVQGQQSPPRPTISMGE